MRTACKPGINKTKNFTMCETVLYAVWTSLKGRCNNPNNIRYKSYGGRGITVCDEWVHDFMCFRKWAIENGHKEGLQIDRKNNDGNYEPGNCQFITNAENNAIGKKRISSNNTSGFVGIRFNKNRWVAVLNIGKEACQLGRYRDLNDAIKARIRKEIELFGEQRTNLECSTEELKMEVKK